MDKTEIIRKIREITDSNVKCGVEIYVCVKSDTEDFKLEKMAAINTLKDRIRTIVLDVISQVYLSEEAEYFNIIDVIDNKKAIYILEQNEKYKPFALLNKSLESVENFKEENIKDVLGFIFKINVNSKKLFLYQHAYVGSKLRTKNVLRIVQKEDIFEIVDKEMLKIDKRSEMIILDNTLLVKNVKVLQDYFGFQIFIRNQAKETISKLEKLDIIGNVDKLKEYQNEEKLTISKKLMKIQNSPVLQMKKADLINKIPTISRYKGMIHIENGKIKTNTKKDIDNLMKLLNDDYVKSELTEQEYDSTSKILLPKE